MGSQAHRATAAVEFTPSRVFHIATLAALLVGVCAGMSHAQYGGGYVVHSSGELPVVEYQFDVLELPVSPSRMDAKAVGMGKAQVAVGRSFNAMMDNPALLSRKRFTFDSSDCRPACRSQPSP